MGPRGIIAPMHADESLPLVDQMLAEWDNCGAALRTQTGKASPRPAW
jgi:hypothetical protein